MTRACNTCNNGCGNGIAQTRRADSVFRERCAILCKVRSEACQGLLKSGPDGKRVQLSRIAEERARTSRGLDRAIAQRTAASAAKIKRYLAPIRDRIMREARNAIGRKAAQKVATGWIKAVPILNVLSTAYDIYDLASTGYDIYKMVDEALGKFKGNTIYEVFPDLAIKDADGKLKDIYDFKFDGDRYRNEQDKLYDEALRSEGVQNPDVK